MTVYITRIDFQMILKVMGNVILRHVTWSFYQKPAS